MSIEAALAEHTPGQPLPPVIGTYSGGCFHVLEPRVEEVKLIDIAHALSQNVRYTGHVSKPWSVALHCLKVSSILADEGASFTVQLQGLLHDAPEAYLVDLPRPLKDNEWPNYRDIDHRIQGCIALAFDVPFPFADHVKAVDDAMISREVANFFKPGSFMWRRYKITEKRHDLLVWAPEEAERLYIERFEELSELRGAYER